MSWVFAFLTGVLTAVCAAFGAGVVANACTDWYRMSSREGASGYFIIGMGLLGAIVGFVLGVVVARVVGSGGAAFWKSTGISLAIVVGVTGASALLAWALADIAPEWDGESLDLVVELKLPVGDADPRRLPPAESYLTLGMVNPSTRTQRTSWRGVLQLAQARREDERWVVTAVTPILSSRGQRTISLTLDGKDRGGFLLSLEGKPGRESEQWSVWLPRQKADGSPWPASELSYRYRVEKHRSPSESPDPEPQARAAFEALTPDAPLEKWLAFQGPSIPEARWRAIVAKATERPVELAALMQSEDDALAEPALEVVSHLAAIDPQVLEAMRKVERALAQRIRVHNEGKGEEAARAEEGNRIRSRFSLWHRAWWTVHRATGVDGRPPLEEILKLAQANPNDGHMREVALVAKAHLDEMPKP